MAGSLGRRWLVDTPSFASGAWITRAAASRSGRDRRHAAHRDERHRGIAVTQGTVLMHDSPYTHTVEALPKVVAGLRAKGMCAGRIVPSATPVAAWPGATFTTTAAAW